MSNSTTIEVLATETYIIRQESEVISFIRQIRQLATQAGLNSLYQTKLITAASELARNMLNYAAGGDSQIEYIRQGGRKGIRLTFSDKGPGIENIDKAMMDGYSTGTGMGLGLPGAKRLVNEFTLTSVVGEGTTVTIIMWTHG
ncbi:anti-sigma regulatory factor [Spirosoma soli]|uniref:Anti-sigma regulatory factor n=1 Tax=Spirosoma soli TaxID=1770529 RepID=A0ABW5M3H1_9BACT